MVSSSSILDFERSCTLLGPRLCRLTKLRQASLLLLYLGMLWSSVGCFEDESRAWKNENKWSFYSNDRSIFYSISNKLHHSSPQ